MSVSNLEKLRLKLDSDNDGTVERSYDLYPLQRVEPVQRKTAVSIALPGQPATENIFLGISGMEEDIEIEFAIYDDGTDRANGTHTSTVVTVEEQITYLRDTMQDPSFSAAWELDHLTGSVFNDRPVGVFETFSPTAISVDSPKWKPARMTLRVGSATG